VAGSVVGPRQCQGPEAWWDWYEWLFHRRVRGGVGQWVIGLVAERGGGAVGTVGDGAVGDGSKDPPLHLAGAGGGVGDDEAEEGGAGCGGNGRG
jgi:hypothetical protein